MPRKELAHAALSEGIMSKIRDEVLRANAAYAADFGDKSALGLPPARQFAILTCMDARIDPAKVAGLREGDAHVIRNAGGRASDDAIRSLVISYKLLGTREWFVIHHTNCGMELFTDETMRALLASSLKTARYEGGRWVDSGEGPGSRQGDFIDWLTVRDQAESVAIDVERIRRHPLVPADIAIYGYIYQVETGRLVEVAAASAAGRATLGPPPGRRVDPTSEGGRPPTFVDAAPPEVFGVREEHDPRVAGPVVEANSPGGRLLLEIGGNAAQLKAHGGALGGVGGGHRAGGQRLPAYTITDIVTLGQHAERRHFFISAEMMRSEG
ncbi:MAG TPA: carbonic anhydrase [Polyangiaceae bacterium]|nr:carbonic anhydrase [Polyangiaceae bacterium]